MQGGVKVALPGRGNDSFFVFSRYLSFHSSWASANHTEQLSTSLFFSSLWGVFFFCFLMTFLWLAEALRVSFSLKSKEDPSYKEGRGVQGGVKMALPGRGNDSLSVFS